MRLLYLTGYRLFYKNDAVVERPCFTTFPNTSEKRVRKYYTKRSIFDRRWKCLESIYAFPIDTNTQGENWKLRS